MWPFRKREVEEVEDECCDGAGSCVVGHSTEWTIPYSLMFGPREEISEEERRLRAIEKKLEEIVPDTITVTSTDGVHKAEAGGRTFEMKDGPEDPEGYTTRVPFESAEEAEAAAREYLDSLPLLRRQPERLRYF